MSVHVPTRILSTHGPIRVLFSTLAVFSAVALYVAVPKFSESPSLFAVAVMMLFAVEVVVFEVAFRRYEHAAVAPVQPGEFAELCDQVMGVAQSNEELRALLSRLIRDSLNQRRLADEKLDLRLEELFQLVNSLRGSRQRTESASEADAMELNAGRRLHLLMEGIEISSSALQQQISTLKAELAELNIRQPGEPPRENSSPQPQGAFTTRMLDVLSGLSSVERQVYEMSREKTLAEIADALHMEKESVSEVMFNVSTRIAEVYSGRGPLAPNVLVIDQPPARVRKARGGVTYTLYEKPTKGF
jgi:hypothetical protein